MDLNNENQNNPYVVSPEDMGIGKENLVQIPPEDVSDSRSGHSDYDIHNMKDVIDRREDVEGLKKGLTLQPKEDEKPKSDKTAVYVFLIILTLLIGCLIGLFLDSVVKKNDANNPDLNKPSIEETDKDVNKDNVDSSSQGQPNISIEDILGAINDNKSENKPEDKPNNEGNKVDIIPSVSGPYSAADVYENNINSVVTVRTLVSYRGYFNQVQTGTAYGSGFIITNDGYIITNHHVIEDAQEIYVVTYDGTEYEAELIGAESDNDVAVIKVKSQIANFQAVALGDSDKMRVGDDVLTIGNPLGELDFSMSKGIVSSLSRTIQVDSETAINMFQVDCPINEGNSGGPVLNLYGEVMGIASAKYASANIEGLGFCIPINDVKNIISDLITYGKVTNKAYFGISILDVDEYDAKRYHMVEGAYIYEVENGGPAEEAGLKEGDIIVGLADKSVTSTTELLMFKRAYKAGDTVKVTVWRNGEYVTVDLTFTEAPEEDTVEDQNNSQEDDPYNYQNIPSFEEFWNMFNGFGW